MAYDHGVYTSETATALTIATSVDSALPIFIGTAPFYMGTADGTPQLVRGFDDFKKKFGYISTLEASTASAFYGQHIYTLCGAAKHYWQLNGGGDAIIINVANATSAAGVDSEVSATFVGGRLTLGDAVKGSRVVQVSLTAAGTPLVEGKDYNIAYDEDGKISLAVITGGGLTDTSEVFVGLQTVVLSTVSSSAIVAALGQIKSVYARFFRVPSFISVPGTLPDATVLAAMQTASTSINDSFDALCLVDIAGADMDAAVTDKASAGIVSPNVLCFWPHIAYGDERYSLSLEYLAVQTRVDAANAALPYVSASEQSGRFSASYVSSALEFWATPKQVSDTLEAAGIVSTIATARGRCIRGDRTAAYGAQTDPKDTFISVRRMFLYVRNSISIMLGSKISVPLLQREVQDAIVSIDRWLKSLGEAVVTAEVIYSDQNNAATLLDGKVFLDLKISTPVPMRAIYVTLSFDVSGYAESLKQEG